MKFVFISNYFNHHQKPFCEEMYKKLGPDFVFISTTVMREERRKLGYTYDYSPKYVVFSYEGEEQRNKAISLINAADVVLAGAAPNDLLVGRIRSGKLLIRYSERIYKKRMSFVRKIYHFFKLHQNDCWKKNVYLICAGAYTAHDYSSIYMYRKRSYKWGYFPEVKKYDIDQLISRKKTNSILWCGRFIDWKHPDDAIQVAKKLRDDGYDIRLNMIGTGVIENDLKNLINKYDLEDTVFLLGSMSPEKVRIYMEEAGIYLFTSDQQEGWGAVLNEAMNSGCAIVASHAIGSVPYLIKDGDNGIVYISGNVKMLYEKVKYFLDHPELQKEFGKSAYKTVVNEWNAVIASERIMALSTALLNNEKSPILYETGVCSKAGVVYDNWLNEL